MSKWITRELVLFALVACLALVLGFVTFSPKEARWILIYAAPWIVSLTLFVFLWHLSQLVIAARAQILRLLTRETAIAAGVIFICSVQLLIHQPFEFKVLMDELVMAGNAASLHFEREYFTILRTHNITGELLSMNGIIDKRPLLFPLLVSLVHDLTGYRSENVFLVNSGVTVGLLTVIYVLARRLSNALGGILAVILWTSIPLVAINATGGGFELFNVLMIGVVMLCIQRFLVHRDGPSLTLLVFATLLLAQSRYESVLFVGPVALVIAWVWWDEKRAILPPWVIAAPLLIVVYPIQNSLFHERRYWQMSEGRTKPFSYDYFYDNIGHAFNYFFGLERDQPSSSLVAIAGTLSIGLLVMHVYRSRADYYRKHPMFLAFVAAAGAILANFALSMVYHWGELDTYVVHRFSLPMQFLMVMAIIFVITQFKNHERYWKPAIGVAILAFAMVTLPFNARDVPTRTQIVVQEVNWQREFIRKHKDRDILFCTPAVLLPYVERVPGIAPGSLGKKKEGVRFLLEQNIYQDIYVFQRLELDAESRELRPSTDNVVDSDIILEKVEERTFAPLKSARLSRVVGVRASSAIPARSPEGLPTPKEPLDDYMARLMDGLP